jgi:hypothetical protein
MALLKETLSLLIRGDASGAIAEFRKVGDAADRDLGKAETQAEQTSAKLTKIGAASLAAGGIAAAALYSTIKPASDLAEAVNVTGLTFGESADAMESWGDTAATSLGLSKRAALEGAAAIGGLLNNVGYLQEDSAVLSRQLVGLASDMGSAFNDDPAEALEALRSGLAGESEGLKRFNVFLSEAAVNAKAMELGISDGTGALSEHEKAQARLAIIMEQTSSIQGDFANTADGAANAGRVMSAQMEDLKATMGEAVLPVFQDVAATLNLMLDGFNSLPGPMQSVISKGALFGAALLLFGGAASTALGRMKDLHASTSALATRFPAAARGVGVMGAALLGAAVAFDQWQNHAAETEAQVDSVAAAFKSGATDAERWTGAIEGIIAADSDGMLAARMGAYGLSIMDVRSAWLEADGDGDAFYDRLVTLSDGADRNSLVFTNLFGILGEGFDELDQEAARAEGATSALAGSVDSLYRSTGNAAGATTDFGDRVSIMTEPVRTFEEQLSDAADALDRFFGSVLSADRIEANFQQALDDATAAVETHGASFDLSTEAGRANLAVQEDVVQSLHDTADAMVEQRQPADDIRARLQGMVDDYGATMLAAGASKDEVDILIAALLGIPGEVATELENTGYDESIAELEMIMDYLDRIAGQHNAQVFITPSYSSPQGGGTQSDPDFEFAPIETDRSALDKSVGGRRGRTGGGDVIEIHTTVELDGRKVGRGMERIDRREGGLRIGRT